MTFLYKAEMEKNKVLEGGINIINNKVNSKKEEDMELSPMDKSNASKNMS